MTHTQGPLSVHPYTTPPWQDVEAGASHDAFRCASIGIGAGRKIVAQVRAQTPTAGFPEVDNEAELVANAALFIAAPLLLEALAELQEHVIRHACVWDDASNGSHHHPVWGKVASALDSARDTASVQAALDALRPAAPSVSKEVE